MPQGLHGFALAAPTGSEQAILDNAWRLLSLELTPERSFRLLGVGVSSFQQDQKLQLPLPLFDED